MKKIAFMMIVLTLVFSLCAIAEEISVGTKTSDLAISGMEDKGYEIIGHLEGEFSYGWPYNLGWVAEAQSSYSENVLHNAGQVSGKISYEFSGTYLAVAFCETYYAAKIIIRVDGKELGTYTPHINDTSYEVKPAESKIIFVTDELNEGSHILEISHDVAHTSGSDNIKEDGNAYYDNDAYFDYIITRKGTIEENIPSAIELGRRAKDYTDSVLDSIGYKAIYANNEDIVYTWPYDLDPAKVSMNNRNYLFNLGQVGAEIAIDFEGSYLAVVFAECYYAAKVILDVDGEIIGDFTPHTDMIKISDVPYQSKVLFIKDDLKAGDHTLTIFLEAAFTTGDDNVKADGNAYYDNDAFFDCIYVQKSPDKAVETPEPKKTTAPDKTEEVKVTEENNPNTNNKSNTPIFVLLGIVVGLIIIALAVIILRRRLV